MGMSLSLIFDIYTSGSSAFTGEFENDRTRSEFIRLISANLS
jgi:hypothetical protein